MKNPCDRIRTNLPVYEYTNYIQEELQRQERDDNNDKWKRSTQDTGGGVGRTTRTYYQPAVTAEKVLKIIA
jgi:hypothetical protein